MGFAAGFQAGGSVINGAISNAINMASLVQKKKKDDEEFNRQQQADRFNRSATTANLKLQGQKQIQSMVDAQQKMYDAGNIDGVNKMQNTIDRVVASMEADFKKLENMKFGTTDTDTEDTFDFESTGKDTQDTYDFESTDKKAEDEEILVMPVEEEISYKYKEEDLQKMTIPQLESLEKEQDDSYIMSARGEETDDEYKKLLIGGLSAIRAEDTTKQTPDSVDTSKDAATKTEQEVPMSRFGIGRIMKVGHGNAAYVANEGYFKDISSPEEKPDGWKVNPATGNLHQLIPDGKGGFTDDLNPKVYLRPAPKAKLKQGEKQHVVDWNNLSPKRKKELAEAGVTNATEFKEYTEERFKEKKSSKPKRTVGDIKVEQYDLYKKGGGKLSMVAWDEQQKGVAPAQQIFKSVSYGKKLTKDNYDQDEALMQESFLYGTDAWTDKLKTDKKDFDAAVRNEKGLGELNNEFQKAVNDGTYKSGITDTMKQKVVEYLGEGKISDLLGLSGEEIGTRLKIDTKAGDTVAKYVKLISGAAATDKERETLTNIIFGSDYKNEKIRAQKLNAFLSKMKSDNKNTAIYLKNNGLSATAGAYLYGDKKKSTKRTIDVSSMSKEERRKYLLENIQGL